MTQPTDNTATNWRDLADRLTPAQVEKLAAMEQNSRLGTDETATALLEGAREWASANVADRVIFAGIAVPPDARRVVVEPDDDSWVRMFDGTVRKIGDAEVLVSGYQFPDGRTERTINVYARNDVDAAAARQIAAALIEAADELERLA